MKPINILIKLKLISWTALLVGWNHGWATRKDIIDYAVNLISERKDGNDENVVLLAGGDDYNDEELRKLVVSLREYDSNYETAALDMWRLAHLLCIAESGIDEQEKIDRLQDIYAKFNYPQDMSSCSIYSQNGTDPIEAMMRVIGQLRQRFQV